MPGELIVALIQFVFVFENDEWWLCPAEPLLVVPPWTCWVIGTPGRTTGVAYADSWDGIW